MLSNTIVQQKTLIKCAVTVASGHLIFLVITVGMDRLEFKSFTVSQPGNVTANTLCETV